MNHTNGCDNHKCQGCSGKYCASKVSIFSVLGEDNIKDIIGMINRRKYKKGQIIFFEGDVSDRLYIINQGKIKIYRYTKEGKEQILYILSEGDFIGDLSLLKKGRYDFNAEAIEDVNVCLLTKDDFDKIVRNNPEVPLKMLEYAHDRMLSLENLVQTLGTKDVEARLAGLLLSFVKDFGTRTEKGMEIATPLTREEMANYIGITRETISRKLTSLQDEGIIELIGNKKIIVKDMGALESMI